MNVRQELWPNLARLSVHPTGEWRLYRVVPVGEVVSVEVHGAALDATFDLDPRALGGMPTVRAAGVPAPRRWHLDYHPEESTHTSHRYRLSMHFDLADPEWERSLCLAALDDGGDWVPLRGQETGCRALEREILAR